MQRERLSVCGKEIMEIMWERNEELRSSQIRTRVNERFGRSWKRQTVITFLRRLERKEYLTSRLVGKQTSVFAPLISKEEYLREELMSLQKDWNVSKDYLKSLL